MPFVGSDHPLPGGFRGRRQMLLQDEQHLRCEVALPPSLFNFQWLVEHFDISFTSRCDRYAAALFKVMPKDGDPVLGVICMTFTGK
jgi:hypothetical protein